MIVDALLQPISPAAPCGDDLSFSAEFDTILEKRREDDPTLDQGDWVRALKVADWPGVAAQCEALLIERTKDLRVAGWLTDAYARVRDFAGLADGLEICEGLCTRYWEALHPQPDEGDMAQRAGSLLWLLAQVAELSRRAPLVAHGNRRYGLRDIEAARVLQQSLARGTVDAASVTSKGLLTLDELARVQTATPREFFVANLQDVQRSLDALGSLQQQVDAHLGVDGPGFGSARKALEEALESAQRFVRNEVAAIAAPEITAEAAASTSGRGTTGPLQTRAQALQQLRAVADFFRRTEPHSPVAYLADKAAKWGEMPLHAWLRLVLKDPGALANVEELLGVEPPSPSS